MRQPTTIFHFATGRRARNGTHSAFDFRQADVRKVPKAAIGAGVGGQPSIRISLMSTGLWQAVARYTKKLKR
jgi:hypothetical protein